MNERYHTIPSPSFVMEETLLRRNLELIRRVSVEADVEIILAFKAFALWKTFPIFREYISGTTASSLSEARLGYEEMGSLTHTYAPVYRPDELEEILRCSSHITFNSLSQFDRWYPTVCDYAGHPISCGLRLNPEYSEIETDLYNPASPDSRRGVPLADLPEIYLDAVVAVEDHRFEQHCGIDIIAIARAAWNNIKSWSLREGGSTITQQLAKNLYFTQERSFIRKAAEVFMAFRLEQTYSKDEILELYVNSIYFGDGYYCVRDASAGYFGKEPADMTDDEATLLAGIPNAPSVYSLTANPDLAAQRQQYVLQQMVKYGYLGEEEAAAILQN